MENLLPLSRTPLALFFWVLIVLLVMEKYWMIKAEEKILVGTIVNLSLFYVVSLLILQPPGFIPKDRWL